MCVMELGGFDGLKILVDRIGVLRTLFIFFSRLWFLGDEWNNLRLLSAFNKTCMLMAKSNQWTDKTAMEASLHSVESQFQ